MDLIFSKIDLRQTCKLSQTTFHYKINVGRHLHMNKSSLKYIMYEKTDKKHLLQLTPSRPSFSAENVCVFIPFLKIFNHYFPIIVIGLSLYNFKHIGNILLENRTLTRKTTKVEFKIIKHDILFY